MTEWLGRVCEFFRPANIRMFHQYLRAKEFAIPIPRTRLSGRMRGILSNGCTTLDLKISFSREIPKTSDELLNQLNLPNQHNQLPHYLFFATYFLLLNFVHLNSTTCSYEKNLLLLNRRVFFLRFLLQHTGTAYS